MSESSAATPRVRRVHIDTDPGLDDLLALALALASPELSVEAITTVAGNASIDAVTENTRRFLALAGVDIPVGRGASGPLALSRVDAESFHGADGRGGVPIPAIDGRPVPSARAVLRDSLAERHVDSLVALGPLTNVALLMREQPELLRDVELVWMGGTLGAGNVTAVSEFNAYADPAAASLVLNSGNRTRIVGLDVTRCVTLRSGELPSDAFGPGSMGRFLMAVLEAQMVAEIPLAGERLAVLHDPCAICAAIAPDLFRYEEKVLEIGVEEGRERGRLQELPTATGASIHYAVEVHEVRLKQLFVQRLAEWTRDEGT
jgi:inosine-uridine nucleoside N-ribohydrolase